MNKEYKKVIAINSSNRNKNTYSILKELQEKLIEKNVVVEIVSLKDYKVEWCLGCESCIKGRECPIKDDTSRLMKKLLDYDGIILSSPVYMGHISGKLKTFIDRTCKWFHRPELIGKPSLVVCTTAASGLKNTMKYLEEVCIYWGLTPTGKIKRSIKNMNKPILEEEYNSFINHLFMDKIKYRPSMKQLIFFQVQKVLALKILDVDRFYWEKKGWDKKTYYYDCSINLTKKVLASSFFKFLFSKVKKSSIKIEDSQG